MIKINYNLDRIRIINSSIKINLLSLYNIRLERLIINIIIVMNHSHSSLDVDD